MNQHKISAEPSAILRPLVNTMIDLGSSQQSYLVQSIERLEVNDDLRAKWCASAFLPNEFFSPWSSFKFAFTCSIRALEDAFVSHKGHGAIHVLLFVGSKLASHYSKPKAFELIPQDIFLISLLIKSLQDPSPSPPPPVVPEDRPKHVEETFVMAKEELSPETSSILSQKSSAEYNDNESTHSHGEPEITYIPTRDLPRLTSVPFLGPLLLSLFSYFQILCRHKMWP